MSNTGGTVSAHNSLFGNNTATSHPDFSGDFASASYNLLSDGTGSNLIDGIDGNRVGSAKMPLDPLLGPLDDNGGPTLTHALLPGSPALDAGDNTDAPEWDQRGEGYARIVNDVIDIGAFEEQVSPSPGQSPVPISGTMEGVDPTALLFLELSSRRDPFRWDAW